MALVYTQNSSGAIRKAQERKPEKAPPGRVLIKRGRFRVVELSVGYNVQRQSAPGVWTNVCFKAQRRDAMDEFKRQEAGRCS